MSVVAVAAVGTAVVGGAVAADSASKASYAQRYAADQANQLSREQFNQSREDQLPWMNRGNAAGNQLQFLLGLDPLAGNGGGTYAQTAQQIREELLPMFTRESKGFDEAGYDAAMAQHNLFAGGNPELSGMAPNVAQYLGRQTIDEAGLKAAIEKRLAEQTAAMEQQRANASKDPQFGSLLRSFSQADLDKDVVYQNGLQFGLDEGRKATNNMLLAGGQGMLSGAALKALTRFGNDYATTKTNDAYNRFNNNQTQIYNRLAGISGTGQQQANQIANQGADMAKVVGNNITGAGTARGASAIAKGNALSGAIGQGWNMYQQNQLMRNPGGFNHAGNDWSYGSGWDSRVGDYSDNMQKYGI